MSKLFSRTPAPPPPDLGVRCALLSDRPLIRAGFHDALDHQAGVTCCGEAAELAELWPIVQRQHPQVLVVELLFGEGIGLPQLREVTNRAADQAHVLVMSPRDEPLVAGLCLEAGALGFISEREPLATLTRAIRRVAQGLIYLNDVLTHELLAPSKSKFASALKTLTAREFEVFRLVGRGETTRAIARRLSLSVHTVETYRERIRQKLRLNNGSDLAFRAIVWSLLHES